MTATPYLDLPTLATLTEQVRLRLGRWTLKVYQDEFLGPCIRLVGVLPDNRAAGRTIDIGLTERIPPCREPEDYLAWLLHRWCEVWIHEARETFEFSGQLWSDPHA